MCQSFLPSLEWVLPTILMKSRFFLAPFQRLMHFSTTDSNLACKSGILGVWHEHCKTQTCSTYLCKSSALFRPLDTFSTLGIDFARTLICLTFSLRVPGRAKPPSHPIPSGKACDFQTMHTHDWTFHNKQVFLHFLWSCPFFCLSLLESFSLLYLKKEHYFFATFQGYRNRGNFITCHNLKNLNWPCRSHLHRERVNKSQHSFIPQAKVPSFPSSVALIPIPVCLLHFFNYVILVNEGF